MLQLTINQFEDTLDITSLRIVCKLVGPPLATRRLVLVCAIVLDVRKECEAISNYYENIGKFAVLVVRGLFVLEIGGAEGRHGVVSGGSHRPSMVMTDLLLRVCLAMCLRRGVPP